jgi:hypothetical protein
VKKIIFRKRLNCKRHPNFQQQRRIKLTKIISNYIDYETRANGFMSGKKMHFKIKKIFGVSIGRERIRIERKKLSIIIGILYFNYICSCKYFLYRNLKNRISMETRT